MRNFRLYFSSTVPTAEENSMTPYTKIAALYAYRCTGGAVVRITRQGHTHRYIVGPRRFAQLKRIERGYGGHPTRQTSGFTGASTIDLNIWEHREVAQ